MCRNIKTLYNFDPPATDEEIKAAAQQFVRKLTGFTEPSVVNNAPYYAAIDEVSAVAQKLFSQLHTIANPRDREVEAARARAKALKRFGPKEA